MRDPRLTRALDGWFAGAPLAPPPLFAPLRLRGLELPNRVVVEARDGLAAAARTGAGLVLTTPIAVSDVGRIWPGEPTLDDRWDLGDTLVCALLTHGGARGARCPPSVGVDVPLAHGAWPLVSASAIPYGPGLQTPAELDEEGMERIREAFAAAAARAAEAGFAALELDMAEGRLLGSFLSARSNRRADAYGADRLRFPIAVLRAVRESWSGPLIARVDALAVAAAARDAGADAVHVVAGRDAEFGRGHLTDVADRVRAGAGVPTLVGGYLTTLDEVNTIVGAGRADLCVVEPAALATEGGTQA
jgi:anthraniloyl-CoA monooxygenase